MIKLMIFMAGVRRGGQHAASGWLMAQLPYKVIHNVNDIRDLSQIKKINGKNNLVIFTKTKDGIEKTTTRDAIEFWRQNIQCLIIGCEDIDVDRYPADSIDHCAKKLQCNKVLKILVIRDPFNTMASLKKVGRGTPGDLERWRKLAREALGKTQFIGFDHVFLYNKWFVDDRYKHKLAAKLGLEYVGDNDRIYDFGGGSSYDGLKYDGQPKQMDVMNRWRSYWKDKGFVNLFDKEIHTLSKALFGPVIENYYA